MAEAEALVAVAGMTFALMKLGRSMSHINHQNVRRDTKQSRRGNQSGGSYAGRTRQTC